MASPAHITSPPIHVRCKLTFSGATIESIKKKKSMLGVCCLSSLSTFQLCNTSVKKKAVATIESFLKNAGCVLPVQSFDSSVVQHQLKGSVTQVLILFSLPSVATIPTKRKKKNRALDACRLSGLSICQLCGTSFWVWGELLLFHTQPQLRLLTDTRKGEESMRLLVGAFVRLRPLL